MSIDGLLLLLVPLCPGLLALALHRRVSAWPLAMVGAVPALVVGMAPPAAGEISYPWLLLGTRLGLHDADAIFLVFSALVWLVAAGFAHAWIRGAGRERFFVFFLLSMAGNLGALVAQDVPSFYTCFALMSFSAYGLIVHADTDEARHAGRVYIVLVLISEATLALAMILAASGVGATDFAALREGLGALPNRRLVIALAILGFGIKAGAPVLHVWLPLAHPVAPAPASAVLSGAMIVTGLVGWLRFLPIGGPASLELGGPFIFVGLAAAFYAAMVGLDQRDSKTVLAYSSVSQMGVMTVGLGMVLLEPERPAPVGVAIAFFAAHHGLAKCALFLGAGLATIPMRGHVRRWWLLGLALPSLALAGAPLTSGMLAKSAMIAGDAALPERWRALLHIALPLTSVATALLMGRFLMLAYHTPARRSPAGDRAAWLFWIVSLALAAVVPWWLVPGGPKWLGGYDVGVSLAPLAAALGLALAAAWAWRLAGRPAVPPIPQGDVLYPLEQAVVTISRPLRGAVARVRAARHRIDGYAAPLRRRAWALVQGTDRSEAWLNRWQVALVLVMALGVSVALLASLRLA